jgi:hypothetical protein
MQMKRIFQESQEILRSQSFTTFSSPSGLRNSVEAEPAIETYQHVDGNDGGNYACADQMSTSADYVSLSPTLKQSVRRPSSTEVDIQSEASSSSRDSLDTFIRIQGSPVGKVQSQGPVGFDSDLRNPGPAPSHPEYFDMSPSHDIKSVDIDTWLKQLTDRTQGEDQATKRSQLSQGESWKTQRLEDCNIPLCKVSSDARNAVTRQRTATAEFQQDGVQPPSIWPSECSGPPEGKNATFLGSTSAPSWRNVLSSAKSRPSSHEGRVYMDGNDPDDGGSDLVTLSPNVTPYRKGKGRKKARYPNIHDVDIAPF